jgi:SAM-dependent methyltransferase
MIAASTSDEHPVEEALFSGLPDDIERWSLSSFVTPEQVREWCHNDTNRSVNGQDEEDKRAFLERKIRTKGFLFYDRYLKKLHVPLRGCGLEIGAGNFWLSSYLSSFAGVEQIVGVELAGDRIASFRDVALKAFPNSKREKLVYAAGDMHAINRPDHSFDFVVCDAVLHHADNLVAVLRECRRCLKPGGWFVAFREPTLPRFAWRTPVFDDHSPENGSAQYYYLDGWRSAFINGRFVNTKLCHFYEYYELKHMKIPWGLQPLARWACRLSGRLPYPKVCLAAQKPES